MNFTNDFTDSKKDYIENILQIPLAPLYYKGGLGDSV
jgi:hypothetical protein